FDPQSANRPSINMVQLDQSPSEASPHPPVKPPAVGPIEDLSIEPGLPPPPPGEPRHVLNPSSPTPPAVTFAEARLDETKQSAIEDLEGLKGKVQALIGGDPRGPANIAPPSKGSPKGVTGGSDDPSSTIGRKFRWSLNFETRDGADYLDQLQALGAMLA